MIRPRMKKPVVRWVVFDISTEGLEPTKHRIVGVTVKTEKEEKVITSRDEKEVLYRFWAFLREGRFDAYITFNGDHFDIPFLIIRSIKYNVPVFDLLQKSVDMRQILFNGSGLKGKLCNFYEVLGMEQSKTGFSKQHMSVLWEEPQLLKLKETLLEDVKLTWELYKRYAEVRK